MQTDTTVRTAPTVLADPDLSWQENALCAQAGPEFFFPAPGSSTREAKQLCGACEGRVACLEYALAHDERFGVWGGLSEKERFRLKNGRGRG
ncbi:WhiB family transcriptional regulator [Streptomyces sp. NPDC003027]